MATWMVHLRIADKLLNKISDLTYAEYIVGNMAPDSGVPNDDWSVFTPSSNASHFMTYGSDGIKVIYLKDFVDKLYSAEQRKQYNIKQKSFYLGYLTHLLTDLMWANHIVRPSMRKFKKLYDKDQTEWIWTIKKDWYDLDFLYIKKNPNFRAFSIYKDAVGFNNDYIDMFSKDAFDNRREYITGFYSEERKNLEREYPYLNEEEMDQFVDMCFDKVGEIIMQQYI